MTDVIVNRTIEPNIDLLHEELDALALGNYGLEHPTSYPGDIIAKYEPTLDGTQQTSVSDAITNHTETGTTTPQDRVTQDTTDLDAIRTAWDAGTSWDTLTATQRTDMMQEMRRCLLRFMRQEEI